MTLIGLVIIVAWVLSDACASPGERGVIRLCGWHRPFVASLVVLAVALYLAMIAGAVLMEGR